jgi:BirA family biotin operon repressor/biotin-[acetyl-CoA-carboxylase] ligase
MADWLHHHDTCPSTNAWALSHLTDLAHGDAVFTRRQTAGRGRQGRAWESPPGVLTVSYVLDAVDSRSLALAAGLAVVHALADACPDVASRLAIKWPNDVLLGGRKLGGILCEAAAGRVVVGIGANLAAELPSGLAAISLHQVTPTVPGDLDLVVAIRRYLLEAAALIAVRGAGPLIAQVRERDALLGRSLTVATPAGELAGTGAGLDDVGRLLVVVPHGGIAAIEAGHVIAF